MDPTNQRAEQLKGIQNQIKCTVSVDIANRSHEMKRYDAGV